MEILMKLKCSPAASGSAAHRTLKVVDHHRQLQQHTLLRSPDPQPHPHQQRQPHLHLHPHSHAHPHSLPAPLTPAAISPTATMPLTPQETLLPRCMDYTQAALGCCSGVAQQDMLLDMQWREQKRTGASGDAGNRYHRSVFPSTAGNCVDTCNEALRCGPYESATPPCCAGFRYTITTPPSSATPPPSTLTSPHMAVPLGMATMDFEDTDNYEYHEPEENFISIDDAKITGLLLKIGREREEARCDEQRRECVEATATKDAVTSQPPTVVYEIIDLDDEEEREKLHSIKNQADQKLPQNQPRPPPRYPKKIQSPNISLIPKPASDVVNTADCSSIKGQKIIAQIELLDSSSESEAGDEEEKIVKVANEKGIAKCAKTDKEYQKISDQKVVGEVKGGGEYEDEDANGDVDDDDLPLAAATVSCELECGDDDDEEDLLVRCGNRDTSSRDNVVVLASDDENSEFIDEQEEGLELRWDDLEAQKERSYFKCFLCGKKVQSSYNLRRHMMIHTGERPFGCDMCDRRFREFSDLKKHRRRHANESNFVCMVCRVNVPTEHDPTRCDNCDSKSGVIIAAMQPQPTVSPERSNTPLPLSGSNVPPRNQTPTAIISTIKSASPGLGSGQKSPPKENSSSPTMPASQLQVSPPPLTPITRPSGTILGGQVTMGATVDTLILLDHIPAVHRPGYNQAGMPTRREFPCPLCQRPFGTRHNLKRHFMIHTGEKPFSCTNCRKPFREYSTLKKHMVTHQRDRWYKCLRCPQKYRDYLDYMEHKETHPSEEQSSGGDTSSSNAPTNRKRTKTRHGYDDCYDSNDEDSSTGDWLECCECGNRFTELEAYTKHLKQHDSSLFTYECYICRGTFGTHEKLLLHMNHKHNGEQSDEEVVPPQQEETVEKRKRVAHSPL